MVGETKKYEGAVKPSKIEQAVFDGSLGAMRIAEIPSNMQMRIAYGSNNKAEYIGYNDRGVATSTSGWLLQKLEYDASKRVTTRTIAYDSWDIRASATYA